MDFICGDYTCNLDTCKDCEKFKNCENCTNELTCEVE